MTDAPSPNTRPPHARQRLDVALVERGLIASRARARAAIEAGLATVDGVVVTKPGALVAATACLACAPEHPYVSRGALKLARALEVFSLDPQGLHCLDVGASTGGFTEVLLLSGAAHVTAVDVGHGQLHPKLAADPRVRSLEGRDARSLTAADLPQPPAMVVCDASFIGLEKVLATPLGLAAPDAALVALFKPQFQVGPAHVGKGGLVSDMDIVASCMEASCAWLAAQGWPVLQRTESPVTGGDGNREFLLLARRKGG